MIVPIRTPQMIAAIPTRYRGRLYRSRLEARSNKVQWKGGEATP